VAATKGTNAPSLLFLFTLSSFAFFSQLRELGSRLNAFRLAVRAPGGSEGAQRSRRRPLSEEKVASEGLSAWKSIGWLVLLVWSISSELREVHPATVARELAPTGLAAASPGCCLSLGNPCSQLFPNIALPRASKQASKQAGKQASKRTMQAALNLNIDVAVIRRTTDS